MRRRRIAAALLACVAVCFVVVLWYEVEAHPLGGSGAPVAVEVPPGTSSAALVDLLAGHGVIDSSVAFRFNEFFHGMLSAQPGGYYLPRHLSFSAVRSRLGAGPNIGTIGVVPGLTLRELANTVGQLPGHSARGFLAASRGPVRSPFEPPGSHDLEGLVGAGSYRVLPGESDRQLLSAMVGQFDHQAARVGLTPAAARSLGLSPYDVVVAASVVQKEGYLVKNMPQVARVIYNRLSEGDPLQMNAIVLYALGQDGGDFTSSDLTVHSSYNSYEHPGLPPTPIAIPSLSALRDALHPPAGDWLYFVVIDKKGTEAFTNSYEQQLANEQLAAERGAG